jgi:polyisoprenoid-binding protein YceI
MQANAASRYENRSLEKNSTGGGLMKRLSLMVLASVLTAALQLLAQSAWTIDSAHSAAQFQVKHLMISTVRGEFTKTSGTVTFDGKDYSTIKVEAVIQTASINTREPKRDEHLRSADFFDDAAHPTITFKSKQVQDVRGNTFKLVGDLTIRGVTKQIALDVEATPVVKGMNNERRIGAQAAAKINRQDFGVKWNRTLDSGGIVVGNDVQIVIDLELTQ